MQHCNTRNYLKPLSITAASFTPIRNWKNIIMVKTWSAEKLSNIRLDCFYKQCLKHAAVMKYASLSSSLSLKRSRFVTLDFLSEWTRLWASRRRGSYTHKLSSGKPQSSCFLTQELVLEIKHTWFLRFALIWYNAP